MSGKLQLFHQLQLITMQSTVWVCDFAAGVANWQSFVNDVEWREAFSTVPNAHFYSLVPSIVHLHFNTTTKGHWIGPQDLGYHLAQELRRSDYGCDCVTVFMEPY